MNSRYTWSVVVRDNRAKPCQWRVTNTATRQVVASGAEVLIEDAERVASHKCGELNRRVK